jgi:hypothetical protein
MKKIFNHKELSIRLSGNPNSIRQDYIPKKHKGAMSEAYEWADKFLKKYGL